MSDQAKQEQILDGNDLRIMSTEDGKSYEQVTTSTATTSALDTSPQDDCTNVLDALIARANASLREDIDSIEESALTEDNLIPSADASDEVVEASLLVSGTDDEDDEDLEDEEESAEDLFAFDSLDLSEDVLKAIYKEGFTKPTPIQAQAIPTMLSGKDMIGQAQTGTGKTAAFALPILSVLPKTQKKVFALVLEPTRELALQVAESFMRFGRFIDNFKVAPIYGGASYDSQIRNIRRKCPQVLVATPGRLIDLIEKKVVDLSAVEYVVLDEADEMLRMGFIDDVSWILDKVPKKRQTALFSATMPEAIRKIASDYLVDPEIVRIDSQTKTADTVRQRYWVAAGVDKIDAMCRMLEVEHYGALLVFVRTKVDAENVANKLTARGFACNALHGEVPQRQREKIVERLKTGLLDIIVATDVAARGLDVDRITHVINYDVPFDVESYVHRIGRTGRAGRLGEAILFLAPNERRALRNIERVTNHKIEPMRLPTIADVNAHRLAKFKKQIIETIDGGGLEKFFEVVNDIIAEGNIEPSMLAAALAKMSQRDGVLLLDENQPDPLLESNNQFKSAERRGPSATPTPLRDFPDLKMVRYRLAVGRRDGVKPGQIVGAIANEGDIDSKYIGDISIYDTFSIVDLPTGMPRETMAILAKARVCGRALELREYTLEPPRKGTRPSSGSSNVQDKGFSSKGDFNFKSGFNSNNGKRSDFNERSDSSRERFSPRKNAKRALNDLVSPPRGKKGTNKRKELKKSSRAGRGR